MDKGYKRLEIDKVLDILKSYIKTKIGLKTIEEVKLFNDVLSVKNEYKNVDEIIKIIDSSKDLPLYSEVIFQDFIKKAKSGSYLDAEALNQLKNEIITCKDLLNYFQKITIDYPNVKKIISSLRFNDYLYNRISSTISNENTVLDTASSLLKQTRSKINSINKEIRKTIGNCVATYKEILIGDSYTIKDGRFVLPVNTSNKASLTGIVHGVSDSGQTTFIEPSLIVNLENEKYLLQLKEREEVNRILKELTNDCLRFEKELSLNNKIIGVLDVLSAKAKFSKVYRCSIPTISEKQSLNLINARHPLLDQNVVVPNTFVFSQDKPIMLISGPNAGGKTVALKTVGTLCYMAKLGIPLPCDEGSSVCIFRKIFVDIGDNQSIESNLSTFSAHISDVSVIFQYITSKDLVIIDELCNGTDPKEGDSLSVAIVKFLLQKKCFAMISSHYPLLKKFGLTSPNITNASYIFDEKRIEPTFKMMLGVSGKSYAFLISKKFGLPQEIINEGRSIYKSAYSSKIDFKIETLDNKEQEISKKNLEIADKLKKLKDFERELEEKDKELAKKEIALKNKKISDFDEVIDEKLREINDIIEDFKENKIDQKQAEKLILSKAIKEKNIDEIRIGDFVLNKQLNLKGNVKNIKGNKITVDSIDGFTFTADKDSLELIDEPAAKKVSSKNIDKEIFSSKQVSNTLNLIGYHIDEAIEELDRYLDDCLLKQFKEVRIIHGYGTGQLRNAIHVHLKKLSFVKSFQLGGEYENGTGVTVVSLK